MKTKQILMAGALALSMVLSGGMLTGCSRTNSNSKGAGTTIGKLYCERMVRPSKNVQKIH